MLTPACQPLRGPCGVQRKRWGLGSRCLELEQEEVGGVTIPPWPLTQSPRPSAGTARTKETRLLGIQGLLMRPSKTFFLLR